AASGTAPGVRIECVGIRVRTLGVQPIERVPGAPGPPWRGAFVRRRVPLYGDRLGLVPVRGASVLDRPEDLSPESGSRYDGHRIPLLRLRVRLDRDPDRHDRSSGDPGERPAAADLHFRIR